MFDFTASPQSGGSVTASGALDLIQNSLRPWFVEPADSMPVELDYLPLRELVERRLGSGEPVLP